MYSINGTINFASANGTITKQIATFYLDKNVQGIVNEKHAEAIACDIVNPTRDEKITVSLCACFIKRME